MAMNFNRRIFASLAAAAYFGVASATGLSAKMPRLADPVPLPGNNDGPHRRRMSKSVLGNALSRRSSHMPHCGRRECLRRRIGGFFRIAPEERERMLKDPRYKPDWRV